MSADYPRSDAQRDASRINGSHSHGPITPEGKARSCRNGFKHGLRSPQVVLANESQNEFNELLNSYIAEFQPLGRAESDLVMSMVAARWRIERIRRMEVGALNNEMFIQRTAMDAAFDVVTPGMRQADALTSLAINNPGTIDYFHRSEERLERMFERTKKQLLQLQTMRLNKTPTLVLQPALTLAEITPDTSEPDSQQPEIDNFAWLSQFQSTPLRPSTVRSNWFGANTPPTPEDPGPPEDPAPSENKAA